VVGPGTRLVIVSVPGKFEPLGGHASNECKAMVAGMSANNIRRSYNASNAKGMVTGLASARLLLRVMLHR
jgi:hypothetical protein